MTDNKIWLVVGAVAAAFAVGAGVYWWTGREGREAPAVVDAPPQDVSPPQTVEPEPADVELPPLGQSDEFVRQLVGGLSSHPRFAAWLVTDDLIQRFVVTVENVADGSNPASQLPFLRPGGRFVTTGAEPELRIDPRSYARYDGAAAVVDSIDAAGVAELYRTLRPLIDEAYRELGYPEGGFDETLERAIRRLLETPVLERQDATLISRAPFFEFVDENFEALSPVQKQLMGMGPQNVRVVQAKLRELAAALGIPAERLPRPVVLR